MHKPSSTSRPTSRSLLTASIVCVSFATLISTGGCSNDPALPVGAPGAGGAVSGAVAAGGSTIASGGGAIATGGATVASGGGTLVAGGGGANSGGSESGSGGTGAEADPCVDAEPPEDPEWPDATCENWANESDACEEDWFASYCDASCGRCVPKGGSEPKEVPCEDLEPPEDPEWPDATCDNWANESDACEEDWFASYCDISCGRCVPKGGLPEPEEEPCEDLEPPEDPEWPGATCAEWTTESDACEEDWFAEYCDIGCGRCIPEGGLPEVPGAPDCSGEGFPDVTGGDGFATRYWDCCQTHCSQFNGQRCGQDGVSNTGDSNSACNGGGSFACYSEAPRAVSECLAYGYIAKTNPDCGGCYRIEFTGQGEHNANDPGSKLIAGKQMIVKVSNTGGDVAGNQFDLMVPGGGVGQFNACSNQWGTSDLGEQYGGFLSSCTGSHSAKMDCVRQECQKIPEGDARDGCLWFVDWFQVADNPKFTSQPTDCPF